MIASRARLVLLLSITVLHVRQARLLRAAAVDRCWQAHRQAHALDAVELEMRVRR